MFLYLNSGYAGLFLNSSFNESNNHNYNNKNGVSVYNGHGTVKISNVIESIYGKFDFYISESTFKFVVGIGGAELNDGLVLEFNNSSIFYQCRYNTQNATEKKIIYYDSNILHLDSINTVCFYFVPSTEKYNGFMKIIINDIDVISSYIDLDFECSNVEIYSENLNVFLSNFIFSDDFLGSDCEVFSPRLSIAEDTNMTFQQDIYVASQLGQKVIQSITVDDLILQYGRNANVIGITIAGMSIDGIGTMVSVEKYNSKYITRKQIELSNNQEYIMDSELLQDMKLHSFVDRTYGWVAKL